ncbi:hypothetical protein T12_4414 [Trichinella patagoniensis]|uniref:Uncharacterized protein n=1 Tax=Trichinella patagoniensis TaxID=990121 RepID=A0A0V1A2G9_9BILA|nr:hypothetical protein T12_4414 [Trichinella patagoniensis]
MEKKRKLWRPWSRFTDLVWKPMGKATTRAKLLEQKKSYISYACYSWKKAVQKKRGCKSTDSDMPFIHHSSCNYSLNASTRLGVKQ